MFEKLWIGFKFLMKTEFYFSILSDNTVDLSPCFMFHFPDRVILINAPEGIQRYLLEKNIKRTKLCDIIFLDNEYDSIFGIWGMFLSFPEVEGSVINFHTHVSLNRLINTLNKEKFVSKSKFHEIIYSENNYLNLTEIPISSTTQKYSNPESSTTNTNIPPPRRLTHNKFPISIEKLLFKIIKNKKLKKFYLFEITIIKVKNKRGEFDNKKATELGIEGRDRRTLTSGNPVFSSKLNREILPLEVINNFKKGSLFIFVKETKNPVVSYTKYKTTKPEKFGDDIIEECKTFKIIERENNCPNKKLDKGIIVNVFWLLKNKFDSCLSTNFQSAVKEALEESEYNEKFFYKPVTFEKTEESTKKYCLEEYIEYHRNRLTLIDLFKNEEYNFELLDESYKRFKECKLPLWKFHSSNKHSIENYTNDSNNDNTTANYKSIKENIKRIKVTTNNMNDNKENIKIHFLGTCCAIPTRYRTFSSTLISIHNHNILLDCGESTISQLHYKFSEQERLSMLSEISIIFISHTHADHFSGLISVLRLIYEAKRTKGNLNIINKEVTLILPPKIEVWCKELLDYFKYQRIRTELNLNFIDSNKIDDLGIEHLNLKLFDVSHLPDSRGIVISSKLPESSNKVSLIYTGDTKLDDKVKKEMEKIRECVIASDVTILIVESTFENELSDEARMRNHCTTQDSIEIGKIVKSDHIILTHLSARTKGGSIEEKVEEIKEHENVYVASDMSTFIFK